MLRQDPWDVVAIDRKDDRGPMVRVDQFGCDDADDAAVPAFTGDDQHRSRSDVGIVVDELPSFRNDGGLFSLAPSVFDVQLFRQRACLVAQGLVGGQQQPCRDVRRTHAASSVHARREDEADVITVDGLPGQAGRVNERTQPDLVRSAREPVEAELRDHTVLTHQGYDVSQRSNGGNLDEPRKCLLTARAGRQAPARASEPHRRRRGSCRDNCSRGAWD